MENQLRCINPSSPESLIVGKVYRSLPDEAAAKYGLVRIVDETLGEPLTEDGYLYPAAMFVSIELSDVDQRAYADATGHPLAT